MSCERAILAFLDGVMSGFKTVFFIVIGLVLFIALFMAIGKTAIAVLAIGWLLFVAVGFALGLDKKAPK